MSMSDREIHQRYGDGSSLILEKCLDDAQTAPIETQASVGTDRPVVASDINGARAGMVYSDVRRRLLAAGFKPEVRPKGQFCGYSTHCKLPETDACSGTGRDQCSYNFVKGGTRIYVLGVDGVENRPESQTVTAILYW
jgi:hypothetical protein